MIQDLIYGWRSDQDHKPGDQAVVRFRAGTRRKTRVRWTRPTREEYKRYLGRTGLDEFGRRIEDPWSWRHTVQEVLPETESVWREVHGFIVVAIDGNQVRVNHVSTGVTLWAHRSSVLTPGRYRIHDVGEFDTWSRIELKQPIIGGDPHLHVEVVDQDGGKP